MYHILVDDVVFWRSEGEDLKNVFFVARRGCKGYTEGGTKQNTHDLFQVLQFYPPYTAVDSLSVAYKYR